ncbi:MAG: T9SS type A sorting domain-containing protein [Bacteroidota bacterium]|nr:T9SS type A sorting domain-containing protein [Bacteroidota bacterium]
MKKNFTFLCGILFSIAVFSIPLPNVYGGNGSIEQIRSNLYVKQAAGAPILLDGDLTQYSPSYSNAIDGKDARKMSNFSENMGMLRGTTVLVIERRQTITDTDTIFYKLWQLRQVAYQLEFITDNLNHPGMEGFLEDSYLNTSTPINLNGTTTADFSVTNDPASADALRFRIIFQTAALGPLPVTFTQLKAYRQDKNIRIDWRTENENQIKNYMVEASNDGTRFVTATNIKATNLLSNAYSWIDSHPQNACNYYRIASLEIDGKLKYSEVVKVYNGNAVERIKVYPNPIVNNALHFQLDNSPAGPYQVRIVNNSGQVLVSEKLQHAGGNLKGTIEPLQVMKKGIYQLEIITPENKKITEKIIY